MHTIEENVKIKADQRSPRYNNATMQPCTPNFAVPPKPRPCRIKPVSDVTHILERVEAMAHFKLPLWLLGSEGSESCRLGEIDLLVVEADERVRRQLLGIGH